MSDLNEQIKELDKDIDGLLSRDDLSDADLSRAENLQSIRSRLLSQEKKRRVELGQQISRRMTDFDSGESYRPSDNGVTPVDGEPAGVRWLDPRTGADCSPRTHNERLAASPTGLSVGRMVQGIAGAGWKHAQPEFRALDEGGASGGHYLVPTELSREIADLVRARSVLSAAGMQTLMMESETLAVPKLLQDAEFSVKPEGEAFPESDLVFGRGLLTSRVHGTIIRISRELLSDAPGAAAQVESQLIRALAAEVDRLGLNGSGSAEPLGVLNYEDIDSTAVGGSVDWDDIHDMIVSTEVNNYPASAYILHPQIRGNLRKLKQGDGANSPLAYQVPPGSVSEVTGLSTTAMPQTKAVAGDFSQLIFGIRDEISIETSTEAAQSFERHQVAVKVWARFDFLVLRDSAFHILTGISG